MSTLEKTISMLNDMPEKQIEIVYSYVAFLKTQYEKERIKKCLRHINSPSPSFMRGIRGFFFLHSSS